MSHNNTKIDEIINVSAPMRMQVYMCVYRLVISCVDTCVRYLCMCTVDCESFVGK